MRRLALALCIATVTGCTCPGTNQCRTGGAGTLAITSTGLPDGVTGTLTVDTYDFAPRDVASSGMTSLPAGFTDVNPGVVTVGGARVRSAYAGTVDLPSFCLTAGGTQQLNVTWTKIPTSDRLWTTTSNSPAQVVGFNASALTASATVSASVASQGPVGGAVAFDPGGNLWGLGATTADATLLRFQASVFATSGTVTPDTQLDFGLGCVPAARGFAFSKAGDLYVSSPCRNAVYRLSAGALGPGARRTVAPTWSVTVQDPAGLAFDAAGNLWVASQGSTRLLRFDAFGLAGSTAPSASTELGVFATDVMGDTSRFTPSWLAFDANGDLWANDFGSNTFFRVAAPQLSGTGTREVQPAVRVVSGVLSVIEGFLFDEGGGLWSAGAQGQLFRLSPAQLAVSSTAGAPTPPEVTLQSSELGSAANLAIYPAPAALPLWHALP